VTHAITSSPSFARIEHRTLRQPSGAAGTLTAQHTHEHKERAKK
jgi:hypothetical protein